MTKIVTIDIETAPHLAYVWQFWKANIGPAQVKENGYLISFAAKWLGEDDVIYCENRHDDDKELVARLYQILDEADIVIAHNAKKFDIPSILGRGVIHGFAPPSPFKVIDTLIEAKKTFRFPRNTLAYIADALGCAPKEGHVKFPGFELWKECMKGNDEAWAEMCTYNIQDVLTLEEVYLRMRPYMAQHPNVAVKMEDERTLCPKCGSHHVHFRGYYNTNVGKYRKFQCQSCKGWGRTRYTEYPKDKRKALATHAV